MTNTLLKILNVFYYGMTKHFQIHDKEYRSL